MMEQALLKPIKIGPYELPNRMRWDENTFYVPGAKGYTDYPRLEGQDKERGGVRSPSFLKAACGQVQDGLYVKKNHGADL